MAAPARAGFTLIEVLLVLVVLAIAGVIAYPALQPALESARAETAGRRTAAFLDDVRRRAVLGRAELEVACRPREGRLVLRGGSGEPRDFRVPEGMTIVSCRPDRVRYFPQGSSTGMALVLRDRRGRERRVAVGAFTGLAAVVEAP
ncbi:MAG TPA: prepilin-type N-terminal cleavage/methylation domain-containing protein [bacterium]